MKCLLLGEVVNLELGCLVGRGPDKWVHHIFHRQGCYPAGRQDCLDGIRIGFFGGRPDGTRASDLHKPSEAQLTRSFVLFCCFAGFVLMVATCDGTSKDCKARRWH